MDSHNEENESEGQKEAEHLHHHHILSNKMGLKILVTLLICTLVTVIASRINFGAFNFPIAMFIASFKALLVVLFFMGLKYDNNENRVIFGSAFIFFAIFVALTGSDILTRPDNKVKGPILAEVTGGEGKFKKPWESSPEMVAHGKQIFEQNCAICHGAEGLGNGPASSALNPKPRNFHQTTGWKNGRQPSKIVSTLTTGLNNIMPSFSTLPMEDRWSLAWYVISFGPPEYTKDTPEDLKKVGIDLSKPNGGIGGAEAQKKTIPIDFAMERYLSETSTAK